MRKSPVIHGALLVVAVGLAWRTWTNEAPIALQRGDVPVWGGAPAQVQKIALENDHRKLHLERRTGEDGKPYLWALVTKTIPAPKQPKTPPPPPGDGGPPPASQPASQPTIPEPTEITTTREFPVGEEGDKLIAKLAPLTALRDLGPADDAKRADFKLATPKDRLVVTFADGVRELQIGDRVYGGDDRYALEARSGHVFVIPSDVIAPLEGAEGTLRERKLHAYAPDEVRRASLKSATLDKALVRKPSADQLAPPTWAAAATPDKPDQTLANLMDRVEKLMPMEYVASVKDADLTPVVRVEYRSASDAPLGYLALLKKAPGGGSEPEYYIRSERTRVLAKVHRMSAERIDQDLAQLATP